MLCNAVYVSVLKLWRNIFSINGYQLATLDYSYLIDKVDKNVIKYFRLYTFNYAKIFFRTKNSYIAL